MAIMRGVENAFNLVRVAKTGLITVTNTRGTIRAQQPSNAAPFSTLLAAASMQHETTLYNAWGDWFAYLDGALLAFLLLTAFTRRL